MRSLRVISETAGEQPLEVEEEVVIGREEADVAITDSEVSRRHTAVRPVEAGIEVEDLDSMNGTFVDGRRIDGKVTVSTNATLRVGMTEIALEVAIPEPEIAPQDLTVPRAVVHEPDLTVARKAVPPPPDVTVARPVAPQPDVTAPRTTPPAPQLPALDVTAPRPTQAPPGASPGPRAGPPAKGGPGGPPPFARLMTGPKGLMLAACVGLLVGAAIVLLLVLILG